MPTLHLDKTRPYSEVRGERTSDDPHRDVHFSQDGLPFGADEELVPDDDPRTEPWVQQIVEDNGQIRAIKRYPLWNKAMRDLRDKKLRRLERRGEVVDSDDVDFSAWLRGEIDYTQRALFDAALKRFSKKYSRLGDLVDELIFDEQLLPEKEVDARRLSLIDQKSAA